MRYFLVLIFNSDDRGEATRCWFRVWTYKTRIEAEKALLSKFCVLLCELAEDEVEDYPSVV